MTEKKADKQTETLGTAVKAKQVMRPDGSEHTVSGGLYVLDVPGTHVVDGKEVEVK